MSHCSVHFQTLDARCDTLFKMLGVVSDRWTPAMRTFPSSHGGDASSCRVKYVITIVNSVQARFGEYNSGRKRKRGFFFSLFRSFACVYFFYKCFEVFGSNGRLILNLKPQMSRKTKRKGRLRQRKDSPDEK